MKTFLDFRSCHGLDAPDRLYHVIAFDSSATAENNPASSPLTFSHTVSGTNRLLLVGVIDNLGDTVTGVTYNSVSMTQLAKVTDGIGTTHYMYGLLNPDTGANNVIVSYSGGSGFVRGLSSSYTGVLQSGLPDNTATDSSVSVGHTSEAKALTTVADNCWVAISIYTLSGSISSITNGTIRQQSGTGLAAFGDTNAVVTPAGSITLTANFASSNESSIVLVSFAPTAPTTSTSTSTSTTSTSTSTTSTSSSTTTSTTSSTSTSTTSTSSSTSKTTSTSTTSTSSSTTTSTSTSTTSTSTSKTTSTSTSKTTSTSTTSTSSSTTTSSSTSSSSSTSITSTTTTLIVSLHFAVEYA